MKIWKAYLEGGESFIFASDDPRKHMDDAGFDRYALEQLVPLCSEKLIRDKATGDYYSRDSWYWLERCLTGWDVHELNNEGRYEYAFSVDTLKEYRLIMRNRKEGR